MHQFGEGRERKNRPERVADGLQTGSEKVNLPDVDTYDEIDPADFSIPRNSASVVEILYHANHEFRPRANLTAGARRTAS